MIARIVEIVAIVAIIWKPSLKPVVTLRLLILRRSLYIDSGYIPPIVNPILVIPNCNIVVIQ